jgi:ADP-heptose:LPS heptosyltransferase
MILRNDNDLIGDFLGTIPAMIELSKQGPLEVILKDSVSELFNMIPKHHGIKRSDKDEHDLSFHLQSSFNYADQHNLHMLQANFENIGLPAPSYVPKPELRYMTMQSPVFDYVLAPFSRSLPMEQKWDKSKWQELVNRMPDKSFCLLGSIFHDYPDFITGDNVTPIFSQPMAYVCNLLKQSNNGLISVVTGISHLAHALDVKNYLFVNQGVWGKNPDAVCLDKHIPDIEVDEVIGILNSK